MNILCVIPARGGSKGLRNKNIRPVFGKPLIAYTIEAALQSRLINKIVVSTDNEKIARVAHKYKIQVIKRPKRYATDLSPIEYALRHAVRYLEVEEDYVSDIVVWLQANIPIRKKGQIDKVIRKLLSSGADSAVTVYPVSQFPQWMKVIDKDGFLSPLFPSVKEYRRQDVKDMYLLDGAIVAIKLRVLMSTAYMKGAHVYMGKKIVSLIQDRKYTIEVDDKESLNLTKLFINKEKRR